MVGTVTIEDGNLVFELHGVDEFLSIKRSISVPLQHVVSVSTERALRIRKPRQNRSMTH